jgi:hypothetical protein
MDTGGVLFGLLRCLIWGTDCKPVFVVSFVDRQKTQADDAAISSKSQVGWLVG